MLLLELNEVPYRVLEEFRRWRPESAVARLLGRASQLETLCEDSVEHIPHGTLSPWITWPTLHRGITNDRHGITHFGQDVSSVDPVYPPVWQLLAAGEVRAGVFGSLHSYPPPADLTAYAFYLPDTFAPGPEAHPADLTRFQAFNLAMVAESGRNVASGVEWKQALRFLGAAPRLGLRAKTAADIALQLAGERLQGWRRTRRRTYQVVLCFDLFVRQIRDTRPDFATFFTNHVASAMHRYWAAAFPSDYEKFDCDPEWVHTFRGELEFAMAKLDSFLERLMRFVDAHPEYLLLSTSSMGQAATQAGFVTTQLYVRDGDLLMRALGVGPGEWTRKPAMEPDFNIHVSPSALEGFRARLGSLRIAGEPVRHDERENGFFSVIFGHGDLDDAAAVEIQGHSRRLAEIGLENVEIEDRAGSTAYHVPEGHLLVYDPRGGAREQSRPQVSTTELAPAILEQFGLPRPEYMQSSGTLEAILAA